MRAWLAVSWKWVPLILALLAMLPESALALTANQVYEQVKDSIVVVKAYDQKGQQVGLASGVMLPSGDIITNYHVVKGGVRYTVGRGKQAASATLKAGDPDKDLCLLTAPGLVAEPARLGKAMKLKVGDAVYAVGAPQGLELSLSEGIVSQLRGGPPPLIQTTVAISPGSSGGGLFNAKGELVGITTFYLKDSQSLNFALPVEWIAEVAGRKIRERPIGEAPGAPAPGARPKEGWHDRAEALDKAQDWQGMLAHCRRWTKAEPDNGLAWFNLGLAYSKLGRHPEAIEAYREELRLKPDNAYAWNNLGFAYERLGRHQEAIEASREALRLMHRREYPKPDIAFAWGNLGEAYEGLGRHQEAIEAYREALRLKPDNAGAWYHLGLVYAQSGNRSAALEAVQQLRRLNPQMADQLLNVIRERPRGEASVAPVPGARPQGDSYSEDLRPYSEGLRLYQSKKYGDARTKFYQYLKDAPYGLKIAEARYHLADSFFQEGKYQEAAVEFNKLASQFPKSILVPAVLLRQGLSYKNLNQESNYQSVMKKLVNAYPQSPEAQEAKKRLKEGR